MGHKLAVIVLVLCASSATGQKSSEFEAKYGKPVIAYLVSEHIWMTPEYSSEGQVCRMRLHPRRFAPNTNYVSPTLPFPELEKVLNQLVPIHTRGAKKDPFDHGATGGGVEWRVYGYQNVEFTFVSPFNVAPDSWKTRKEYVFSVEASPAGSKPNDSAPSDHDFSTSQHLRIEIVNIRWKGSECEKQ